MLPSFKPPGRAVRTTPDFLLAGQGDPDSIQSAIDESELVHLWRSLPPEGRRMVLDAAQSASRVLVKAKPTP